MNEQSIIHEALPVKEPIDQVNSPALKVRIALGRFDTNPIGENLQLPATVDQKSLNALHNQNVRQRQKDAENFAQRFANKERQLSSKEIRHEQMKVWSNGAFFAVNNGCYTHNRR